ncbi:dynein intermediate chain 3, ciliary-like [Phlebotomus argentipes]|uniref:dynein intermediate chain 3, ciliary-like n=1 Tax=Phlebotomus argentipes TaxID=94469 RepID=UPI002892DDC2|nr:dynein intermediate chain 3, ciliary-like [Phlebotomus argentipes]
MNKEVKVVVTKTRRDLGLPCIFRDRDKLECHVPSEEFHRRDYIMAPATTRGVQACTPMGLSVCNTENVEYISKGIQHTEGGWPKDVNKNDSEQTQRYRKKIERDEAYSRQVLSMARSMEHFVQQNNALNIYECFFEGLEVMGTTGQCDARTILSAKDPSGEHRAVKRLSWAPERQDVIAGAYCSLYGDSGSPEALIWDIRSPNEPLTVLNAWSPPNCIKYNSKDFHLMIGGLVSGQVAQWDPRVGHQAMALSPREVSHRECVTDVLWLSSKNNTEFFSGSSDGQVLTWDVRHLREPIEEPLIMDPERPDQPSLERAEGVTFLEFEATIPTRFMVGTERGHIFSCNRKGKTSAEKLPFKYMAHCGPIYALERNPAISKMFLSIGDWQAKVWSEECRESAIIWTRLHKMNLYCGAWSRTRFTLFFVGREDGVLDGWDLLLDQHEPVISVKLCDEPLISLVVHESGEKVAVGTADGTIFAVKLSQFLVENAKNDKALFTEMLERETRRQKVIEGKMKEMKLKNKTAREEEEREKSPKEELAIDDEELSVAEAFADETVLQAEKNFFGVVKEEREKRAQEAENRIGAGRVRRPPPRIDIDAGRVESLEVVTKSLSERDFEGHEESNISSVMQNSVATFRSDGIAGITQSGDSKTEDGNSKSATLSGTIPSL